jgi:hypothetical protein
VEPEKQPLLGNARTQQYRNVTIQNVTRTAVAMEQLSKHISAEKNTRDKGTVFSVMLSVPRGYKKGQKNPLPVNGNFSSCAPTRDSICI